MSTPKPGFITSYKGKRGKKFIFTPIVRDHEIKLPVGLHAIYEMNTGTLLQGLQAFDLRVPEGWWLFAHCCHVSSGVIALTGSAQCACQ